MKPALRFLTIGLIIYSSLMIGGVHEYIPTVKLIHQVGAALLFGAWLIYLWRSGKALPVTRLDAPLWALGGGWLIAALFAHDPRVSLEFVWYVLLHILIFYLFVYMLQNGMHRWVMEGLVLSAALVIVLTVREMLGWYLQPSLNPPFINGWPHWSGLSIPPVIHPASRAFEHKNPLGAYCLLAIPVLVAWADTARGQRMCWIMRILAGGLMGVLVLTQSRGAYLGFVALLGTMILITVLHEKRRFPPALQRLVNPPVLIAAAAAAGLIVFVGVFWLTTRAPSSDDISRIDLWYSAVHIFEDHPLLGVGLHQFATVRPWYYNWDYSPSYLSLWHAHNLPLNVLAEGGGILFTLCVWLLIRFAHIWIDSWKVSSQARRRRLEGILTALVAFGVHNLVDTFSRTSTMVLVLAMAAYVVDDQAVIVHARFRQRAPIFVLLVLLIAAQIAFIPVHWGALAQHRALKAMASGNNQKALEEVRSAENADPDLELYQMQEATILGFLANDNPQRYLDEAIRAYEDSLRHNESWSTGWQNLGALYAQAGHYVEAARAARTAIRWDPVQSGYYLKLGEYYDILGHHNLARKAYFDALQRATWLASSGFWTDPAHPERAAILPAAVDHFLGEGRAAVALDIAVFSGDMDLILRITYQYDRQSAPPNIRLRLDALWPEGATEPCLTCYALAVQYQNPVRHYIVWAERLRLGYGPAPAHLVAGKAAHAAIFLSDGNAGWGWYILALQAEQDGEDDDEINKLLAKAVKVPYDYRTGYAVTLYNTIGNLDVLPQARTPLLNPILVKPWIELANRYESTKQWKKARNVYEDVLVLDPYAWNIRNQLDSLPTEAVEAIRAPFGTARGP